MRFNRFFRIFDPSCYFQQKKKFFFLFHCICFFVGAFVFLSCQNTQLEWDWNILLFLKTVTFRAKCVKKNISFNYITLFFILSVCVYMQFSCANVKNVKNLLPFDRSFGVCLLLPFYLFSLRLQFSFCSHKMNAFFAIFIISNQQINNKSKWLCVYYCEIEKCNSCYLRYSALFSIKTRLKSSSKTWNEWMNIALECMYSL